MFPSAVNRAIATGLLLLYVPGCTSWRVQSVPAAELFADRPPDRVRIDSQDGSRLTLGHPRLSGDSIVGLVKRDTTGIPLDAVDRVAVRRGDALKTVGLTALIIGAGVAAFYAIVAATLYSGGDWGSSCPPEDSYCEEGY